MTNTQYTTTKTDHYFRALMALAVMVLIATMLLAPRPASASTTFTVNSTSDIGDPNPNDSQCVIPDFSGVDHCSLRAAIQNANGTPGADVIDFNIPGTGVQTIAVNSQGFGPLPEITDTVTINGYTQTDASPNTKAVGDDAVLKVELDGTNLPDGFGFLINNSSNSVIRGLVINRFSSGVAIANGSIGNRVEGNFIGTDPTGTLDRGNAFAGVVLLSSGLASPSKTVVGGPTPDKRNIISANRADGVNIVGSDLSRIEGNYVGTDRSGTKALGNDNGIKVQNGVESGASGTTVGGTTVASRNVISGNDLNGVLLVDSLGTNVLGNRIGTSASGTTALGNHADGVAVSGSSDNKIGDGTPAGSNTISFNGLDGVALGPGTGNEISRNSIFSNVGLGIDLTGPGETFSTDVSTPNDADDPNTPQVDPDGDTGSNNLQNKPVLTSAATSSTATTVKGTLNSTPGASFTVEFFSNPSGTDEGKTFVGSKSVTTDASGNASFSFQPASKVTVGQAITATATDASGNTSEFSAPVSVKDGASPTVKSVAPANNATGVSPTANVTAVFSEAMDSSTINASTFNLKKSGTTKNVSATVSYDAAAKKATLDPASSLTRGAKYVATVTIGTKDLDGNALDQDPTKTGNQPRVWSFTVHQ